jgi:hypothetical protein
MSTSIKLEPAADRTGGDPPVGVLNPTHADIEFFERPLTVSVGVLCGAFAMVVGGNPTFNTGANRGSGPFGATPGLSGMEGWMGKNSRKSLICSTTTGTSF